MRNQPPEYSSEVLDALTAHIAVLDADGAIIGVNNAWRSFCECNGGATVGYYVRLNYLEVCERAFRSSGEPTIGAVHDALRAILRGDSDHFSLEYPCHAPGEERWFILHITSCKGQGPIRAVVAHEDITKRKFAEQALERTDQQLREAKEALEAANAELRDALSREEQLARTDELTGAFNRRHFFETAERFVDIARRYQQPLALILFDLDHFKSINDRYGHQTGDRVLQHVCRIATAQLRSADVFARYGGEELVALMPNTTLEDAERLANRIRGAVETQPITGTDLRLHVTLSAGVAALGDDCDTLDRLIRLADAALYGAKDGGRNQVRAAR